MLVYGAELGKVPPTLTFLFIFLLYIGEKIRDATQKAAIRRFGNHPALIFLPEFIEAQKGYGPKFYEDNSAELRRELGLESEDPTLEEAEELFEESKLLEDVIDDELSEIEDIVEQLDEKDLDKIVEDLEKEIPEEGEEIETNEDEEEEKCYSISIGSGENKITFNTCDNTIIEKESPKLPDNYDKPPDLEQELTEDDTVCPVILHIQDRQFDGEEWLYGGIDYFPGGSFDSRFRVTTSLIFWWKPTYDETESGIHKALGVRWISGLNAYAVIGYEQNPEHLHPNHWRYFEPFYQAYISLLYTDGRFGEFRCRRYSPDETLLYRPEKRSKPQAIKEKKSMKDDCCKANLALTRKIARNIGAIADGREVYPSNVKPVFSPEDYGFPLTALFIWVNHKSVKCNSRENSYLERYSCRTCSEWRRQEKWPDHTHSDYVFV